jgi:hypothetical protein
MLDRIDDFEHWEEQHVEERVARLETHVGNIQKDIVEMKHDVKALNTGMTDLRIEMLKGFARLRMSDIMTRIWMLTGLAAVLGVMARGFKWL